MNRKGSLLDIMLIMIILAFAGIVILLSVKIGGDINTHIQDSSFMPDNSKEASASTLNNYSNAMDSIFLFLLIGLVIGALILAALVRVHPIFIPFFFIALILIIFLSGVMSNVYTELAENDIFSSTANDLIFISTILSYLPLITGVIGIFLMVIMYKLWSISE